MADVVVFATHEDDQPGVERAGERVIRVTRLERFDEGAVAWRFIFYRAESVWQVVDVASNEDLGVLFGDAPWSRAAEEPQPVGPSTDAPGDATPQRDPAVDNASEKGSDAEAEADFRYEIDIDGRR